MYATVVFPLGYIPSNISKNPASFQVGIFADLVSLGRSSPVVLDT
jgi:hypothetical protein